MPPEEVAVLVASRMGAFHRPAAGGLDRCGPPAGAISPAMPRAAGTWWTTARRAASRSRCWPGQGVQGRPKQPVVAAVGRRRDRAQRDATRVGDRRAFPALLATIHRARPGDLSAAGALVMQPSTARCSSSRPNSCGWAPSTAGPRSRQYPAGRPNQARPHSRAPAGGRITGSGRRCGPRSGQR
jgi:hypothetical protein